MKKPWTVTRFLCSDQVIALVNGWGRRYQKEERANKIEFLNRKKLKFNWDNDELDESSNLIQESV